MHDEATRQAPEPAPAGPVRVAPKRASKGVAAAPTVQRSGLAEPVFRGVQVGPTSRIQRRLSGVIQRDDDEEEGGEVESAEVEAPTVASVTGKANGPVAMVAKYNEAATEAKEAIDEIDDLPMSNPTQIKAAKKAVNAASELVETAEEVVDDIETKRDQVEDLYNNFDGDFDGDDYAALEEASGEYTSSFPKVKSGFHKLNESFLEESGKVGLAADTASQSQAQTEKMTKLRGYWGSPALAKGHYDKHASDTKATSEEDYLTRAHAHNNLTAGGKVLQKVKGKDTLTFNTATGDFGVKANDGNKQIRTFFRPGAGKKYYEKQ